MVAIIDHQDNQVNQVNQAPVIQVQDNQALVNMAKEFNMAALFNIHIHMHIQVNNKLC